MNTEGKYKNIRISNEALAFVIQVSSESLRNLTGATEYLIIRGFEVYMNELQMLKSIKSDKSENLSAKNKTL